MQVFVGGPMAYVAPEALRGLAARIVAEDALATVANVTHHLPLSPTRATSHGN